MRISVSFGQIHGISTLVSVKLCAFVRLVMQIYAHLYVDFTKLCAFLSWILQNYVHLCIDSFKTMRILQ